MASIDRVAPDLILVDAERHRPRGPADLCRALKDHPATMMLPVIVVVSSQCGLQMAAYRRRRR